MEKEECIICYEHTPSEMIITKCGHIYCTVCFVCHMRCDNLCAMCRTELVPPRLNFPRIMSDNTMINISDRLITSNIMNDITRRLYQTIERKFNLYVDTAFRNNTIKYTRTSTVILDLCRKLFKNLHIEHSFWYFSMYTLEKSRDWYDGNDV
jgi:hypothetical protein